MSLEEELNVALNATIEIAKKHGYVPTYFVQMLAKYGGVETAKRLLVKSEPQTGLFELWRLELLYESMEAVIWDNPKFHRLFTAIEIEEAHRRLDELGYFKESSKE
jgi:hypothetical protein